MKEVRVGYCVAERGKNGFKADVFTADTNREEAIMNHVWGKKAYRKLKRRGEAKTIPVYVNEADLEA